MKKINAVPLTLFHRLLINIFHRFKAPALVNRLLGTVITKKMVLWCSCGSSRLAWTR